MSAVNRWGNRASSLPSPDEWRRLAPLVDALLDAPLHRRPALLVELSAGDTTRQGELQRLVAECERAYPPLEGVAADRFAAVFADEALPLPELLGGRYRLGREVGRGGMAIVHIARDLKHGRDVAVKIVRPALAASLGRARFLREIEIAARLHHPHIVPLYDSGEEIVHLTPELGEKEVSLLFYVMPYEPGASLRERLSRDGPLPLKDAVLILHDVCEALSHAHQQGIVHRDIKPDNVLLSGRHAMVSDFGVARAISEAAEATIYGRGLAFGTAAYMAPEQAENDPHADHRADIYALGVMAYELLAGRPPYGAKHQMPNELMPLVSIRSDVPEALAAAITKCLAEQPADRWQSADQLLERLDSLVPRASAAEEARHRWAKRSMILAGTAASIASIAAIVAARDNREPRALLVGHASQLTSDPGLEVQPSISPDGRYVAYAAGHSLRMHTFVRPVSGGRAMPLLADTSGNEWLPRWSPDGKRILYLSNAGVFSAPALGGAARMEVPSRSGIVITSATWSPDGREIAFVRGDSLLARGVGTDRNRFVTTGFDLHSCNWSRDASRLACVSGNHFYMTVGTTFGLGPMFGNLAPSRIVVIPARGGPAVSVTDSGWLHQSPVWSRDGKTLYYVSDREGPRDVYALRIGANGRARGEPVRLTTGIGAQSIDFSPDGKHIVYAVYASTANIWALAIPTNETQPAASAVQITSGNQTIEGVRVSPDGKWLVYDSNVGGNSDVYRVPVAGGDAERLTRGPMDKFRGVLSPSGKELVFHTFETGSRNISLLPLDGGPLQQLTRSTGQLSMATWSPGGNALAFFDMVTADVLVMRRDQHGNWGRPRFIGGHGWRPEWSPDGREIVFVSPADGRIGMVSADSGAERDLYVPGRKGPPAELAIFSAQGRELYFKSHDNQGRATFWSIPAMGGRPRLLARLDDPAHASNRFEFASDGRRFYFTVEDRQSDIWVAEIARR
ncbi:MAG: protein kinase domain-containing protein [Gemmatimonadaceae bacterium]